MQAPAPFEYRRVGSVPEAVALLDRLGDTARLVAGGHSLLPMMKLRLADFEYLIDINDLHGELGYIRAEPGLIRIGAMTRHRELLESDRLAAAFPVFRDAEHVIADPVVRNRGTLGGSLRPADPSEDLSAACTTLDASCVIQGADGQRVVPMGEFHQGPYETAVGDAEMFTEVRFPVRPNGPAPTRRSNGGPVTGRWCPPWAAVWLDGDGLIADARVGLAAVGPNVHRAALHRPAPPGGQLRRAATGTGRGGTPRGRAHPLITPHPPGTHSALAQGAQSSHKSSVDTATPTAPVATDGRRKRKA